MAKKIRGIKLKSSDINKNNGKEISHTINKIKEHEVRYTAILVVVFMVLIVVLLYLFINVDSYNLDAFHDTPAISTSSSGIMSLNNRLILSDEAGLGTDEYVVEFSNNSTENINYIIRIVNDEDSISECDCGELIVPFDKIKYSVNSSPAMGFDDSLMVIKTGMIEAKSQEKISIRIWFDESLDKSHNNYFFGRVLLEQIEDMDRED